MTHRLTRQERWTLGVVVALALLLTVVFVARNLANEGTVIPGNSGWTQAQSEDFLP